MAAYVIADIEITDSALFQDYRSKAAATIVQYGGRTIIGGNKITAIEGDWNPKLMVVVEFENMENLKKWWDSPEYSQLIPMRQKSSNTNVLFVEGV